MKDILNGAYSVSEDGRVFSNERITGQRCRHHRELKQYPDTKGYMRVRFCVDYIKTTAKVHRLVAECYLNNPYNKPQVNHIDGNKNNNHVSNLEWCTNQENMTHRYSLNVRPKEMGAYYEKQGWTARVTINGKRKYIGRYKNREEAIQAVQSAIKEAA